MRRRRVLITGTALLAVGLAVAYGARRAIYNQVTLAVVADDVRGQTDEELALGILEKVVELAPRPLGPDVVIDDNAVGTLVRGGGWCDNLAMALVQLAEVKGFRGQLLFLHDETGVSPHSVAALDLDGRWVVLDPYFHAVSRTKDGRLATADDIASGAAPVTSDVLTPDLFGRAEPFYETPTDGVKANLRQAARALARATTWAAGWLQDVYLAVSAPSPHVTTSGQVWEDWRDPGDLAYRRARHHHLFGRMDRAAAAYQQASEQGHARAQEWLSTLDEPSMTVDELG